MDLTRDVLVINDFVLVQFATKNTKIHDAGVIEYYESYEKYVMFTWKYSNEIFIFPETGDTPFFQKGDIV